MVKRKQSFGKKLEASKKQIFVGREQQITLFQQNIKLDPYAENFTNIFNIYGQGGVGKTFLTKRYLSIAKTADYYTAFVDTEDSRFYDVLEVMNFIAEEFEKQDFFLKSFTKRYKTYLQEKGKLEADPECPKGTFGKLFKSGIKKAFKLGTDTLPYGSTVQEFVSTDSLVDTAGDWADFAIKKITNKDDIDLVLNPLKVLTPFWIEDLYNASEKKSIAIFFDTFEIVSPELNKWLLDLFKEQYGEIPCILLVISGQKQINHTTWGDFGACTEKISLTPFTKEEAETYLKQKGITNATEIEAILSISGCLPVYLSLLADNIVSTPNAISNPNEKVVERFLKHIQNPIERDLALHASLPKYIHQDLVECLLPNEEKENAKKYFEWLIERPFIEKRGGQWTYHPTVREIMLRHQREVSEKEWERLHQQLAEWFEKKAIKFQIESDQNQWFKDNDWRLYKAEQHFHLLCYDYKKYIPNFIQSIVSMLLRIEAKSILSFVETIVNTEKILNISNWNNILTIGIDAFIKQKTDDMIEMFTKINETSYIKTNIDRGIILYLTGAIYHEKENYNKAIEHYLKATKSIPKADFVLYDIALIYSQKEDYANAIKYYLKTIKVTPNNHNAFFHMGAIYARENNYDKAIEYCLKAIEFKPDYYEAIYYMGLVYFIKKDYDKAIEYCLKAIEFKPDYSDAFYYMGLAYSNKGDYDKAIEYCLKAIEFKPDYAEVFCNMGVTYYNKQDYDKAIEYYLKAIEFKPDYAEAFCNMGNVYYKQDYDKAIEYYLKAIEFKPNYAQAFYNMGVTYSDKQDYDKAIEYYLKAIEFKPNYAEAFYNMGVTYSDKEDYDKAIEYYLKAIEFKPDYAEAFCNMGDAYSDKGDKDMAIQFYLKFIKIKPDDYKTLSSIGWNYLLLPKLDKAEEYLLKAWELSSYKLYVAPMNLGHVYLLQNDKVKAIEWYQKSIPLWENRDDFFKGMEGDYNDLKMEEHKISKEDYESILKYLKE